MDQELAQLILTIKAIKSAGQFQRYIDFIQFPFYRNLESNTKINFDFPITVFTGPNGSGKSSCLHALNGAVQGKTPFDFWFSTEVDPIKEKPVNSFFYSYLKEVNGENKPIQVLKTRVRLKNNPDYWETSRPIKSYGMDMFTLPGKERNPPIDMPAIYMDFRAELSAFDKYFYFTNPKTGVKIKNKQDYLRKYSKFLNQILSEQKAFITRYNLVQNKKLQKLTSAELKAISIILGKEYVSGILIEHRLFKEWGYSIQLSNDAHKYSEAFAGSGEVSVVRLVTKLLALKEPSLVILDEPEVSLHPGAQSRLIKFLLDQIKNKKHQVVLTSHSPSIVKGLPKEAIKVFYQNPRNGRFLVKENLTPEEAFFHIEFPVDNRKNIVVEDVLAQEIVSGVLSKMGEETENLFNVKFNPGGESVIKKEFITVFCREQNSQDFVFFDGDQQPETPHIDWQTIPVADLTVENLRTKIREQTGEEIKFSVDGGQGRGNQTQQLELQKSFLDYYLSNVFYLPKQIPEDIIWSDEFAKALIKGIIQDGTIIAQKLSELMSIKVTKQKFAFVSDLVQGESNAEAISSVHRQFLQRWLNSENQDFQTIKDYIATIINRG